MKELISKTVQDLQFSGIRKFYDIANEIEDVISLGVGEPDFHTPWNAREEAIYKLENARTTYTSNAGLLELREEITKYIKLKLNINYDYKTQALVTVGASEGIDLALRALVEPGDEILYLEPCYVSYKPCIILAGGIPAPIVTKSENEFKLTAQQLEEKITDKTKAIIICFPNNPTGAIMTYDELKEIVEILKDKNIAVISDEIYSELTYSSEPHASIAQFPEMYEKTIMLNGFSKAYAMTGWRLGYALGSKEIIEQMMKIHQYTIMCAPTISQFAGIEVLKNGAESVEKMRKEYDGRRRFLLKNIRDMGLECFEPLGAFYIFPSIKSTNLSTEEFCNRLLFEHKLAVVPGTAFGDCGEGFIRISYAYSIENLKRSIERLEAFINIL